MILALSACSAQGLWIVADPKEGRLLSHVAWTDDESTGLSEAISVNYRRALAEAQLRPQDLSELRVVCGPGAFTGLRMSAAFMQGLARSLALPLGGISSYALGGGRPFFIPTRHQLAKSLSLDEALTRGLEFLRLNSATSSTLAIPQPADSVRGVRDASPLWPAASELLAACLAPASPLKLVYGLEPKISGQR
jgi:hypothetical protein